MSQRFTDQARAVVVRARDEARMLAHDSIGCEHMLLGLVRGEDGFAACIFDWLKIDAERVRAAVAATVSAGEQAVSDELPFSPQAKKVLEFSMYEARSLNRRFVGPEHVLLGLLHEEEGLATRTLSLLEVDAAQLARAATASRAAGRFASCEQPAFVTAFARLYVDRRAAVEAGDTERAAELTSRATFLGKTIIPMFSPPGPGDLVVARICALLRPSTARQ